MITNEALFVLRNNLTFTKRVNRSYDSSFGTDGAKIGTVLNIRKPPRFVVTSGPGLSIQDITETSVPLPLQSQEHVDFTFTTADRLLSIDDFSERLLEPAIAAVANKMDYDGNQQYVNVANTVGTVGTTPNTALVYLTAAAVLSNNATPMDGRRSVVMNPTFEATIVDALKGLFQSATQIKEQYEKGQMAIGLGFEWYMDQNAGVQTIGALGGTPAVNGGGQAGTSLVLNGWTAAAAQRLNQGDILQIGSGSTGVYGVNPQARTSTGRLQDFVVTAPASSDGSGNMTVNIWPPITPGGQFQTVTTSPATGALVTVYSTAAAGQSAIANTQTPVALAFHRDAFTMATADLPLPTGGVVAAFRAADKSLGISLRVVQAYDINTDKMPVRIDVLYGWATMRGEMACRVQG
jgi:hypothetical protein